MDEATFRRRLAAWQARHGGPSESATATETADPAAGQGVAVARARDAREARIRAAVAALDAERVDTPLGTVVRIACPSRALPLERSLLARLPGFPEPTAPLVCLDTETTGLATAAGTLVFLIGLGWWEGSGFRQVGLLLADEADELALLDLLGRHVPAGARLVTYNGRAFDWPLLVARFRLRRRRPPEPAGHLDLLPIARRWFRHRLPDARLRSVERHVLGLERIGDIEGWEIPASYRHFLATGRLGEIPRIVDHNERDVLSLARLLVLLAERYADPDRLDDRDPVPAADLAAVARAFRRAGRLGDALACLDAAARLVEGRRAPATAIRSAPAPAAHRSAPGAGSPVVPELQIAAERARVLARLGEPDAAIAAWLLAARGDGLAAARAWIEIAKLHEWRRRDLAASLGAVGEAWRIVERARLLGRPAPDLEADLASRTRRLRRRLIRLRRASPAGGTAPIGLGPRGDGSPRSEPAPVPIAASPAG